MKALREALTLAWLLSTVVAMRANRAAVDRARRHYAQACDSHERAGRLSDARIRAGARRPACGAALSQRACGAAR